MATLATIAGWIVWCLVCLFAIVLLTCVLKERRHLSSIMEFLTLAGVVGALSICVVSDVSKFHLLWLAPAALLVALALGAIIAFASGALPRAELRRRFEGMPDLPAINLRGALKVYEIETSRLGRSLFRAFMVLICSAVLGVFSGWSAWVIGVIIGTGVLCWLIGFVHDSRKVRRGELHWNRLEKWE